jgi:hypothetical protein
MAEIYSEAEQDFLTRLRTCALSYYDSTHITNKHEIERLTNQLLDEFADEKNKIAKMNLFYEKCGALFPQNTAKQNAALIKSIRNKYNSAGGYKKRVGSRAQVMHGTARQTGGGLKKNDLKYNKHGRIVSKKLSALGKKNIKFLERAGYKAKKGKFGI